MHEHLQYYSVYFLSNMNCQAIISKRKTLEKITSIGLLKPLSLPMVNDILLETPISMKVSKMYALAIIIIMSCDGMHVGRHH